MLHKRHTRGETGMHLRGGVANELALATGVNKPW
jgi:hypothetical protein